MTAILKLFGLPGTIALAAALLLAITTVRLALDLRVTKASLSAAKSERDTATARASANAMSAGSWKTTAGERLTLLQACQAENTRVANETAAGLARAEAARTDAERTLAQFTARYAAAIRIPACADARVKLDAACPAMEY